MAALHPPAEVRLDELDAEVDHARISADQAIVLGSGSMKIKVIVHEAEEGGYWAEVPAIPGCATQGDSFEDLLQNLYEAVEACLSVDLETPKASSKQKVLDIVV